MSKEDKQVIVHPSTLIEYHENISFKIPPSLQPTDIYIKLAYNKISQEIRAVCYQNQVIKPERRVTGVAAILESIVPVPKAEREEAITIGRVVDSNHRALVKKKTKYSKKGLESIRVSAARTFAKPLKPTEKREINKSGSVLSKPVHLKKKKLPTKASYSNNSTSAKYHNTYKTNKQADKIGTATHKQVLKQINTSTFKTDKKKTTVKQVKTHTTTKKSLHKNGVDLIDLTTAPTEVVKKVEVSEKVSFNHK